MTKKQVLTKKDLAKILYVVLWGVINSTGNALALEEMGKYFNPKNKILDPKLPLYLLPAGFILNIPNMSYMLGSWYEEDNNKYSEFSRPRIALEIIKFILGLASPAALTAAGIIELLSINKPETSIYDNPSLKLPLAVTGLLLSALGEYLYFREGISEENGLLAWVKAFKENNKGRRFKFYLQAPITIVCDLLEGYFNGQELAFMFTNKQAAHIAVGASIGGLNAFLEASSTLRGVFDPNLKMSKYHFIAHGLTGITAMYYAILPAMTIANLLTLAMPDKFGYRILAFSIGMIPGFFSAKSYYEMVIERTDWTIKKVIEKLTNYKTAIVEEDEENKERQPLLIQSEVANVSKTGDESDSGYYSDAANPHGFFSKERNEEARNFSKKCWNMPCVIL